MTTFETKSLYISAALATVGRVLLAVERRADAGGRAVFIWADPDGVTAELAAQYQVGRFPHIQPQNFVNSIFYMRDRVAAAN